MRRLPIFLHVPRSGGTTLRRELEARCAPGRALVHDNSVSTRGFWKKVAAMDAAALGAVELVAGHLPYGVGDVFAREIGYFTFLREPVARVVSDYHWVRASKNHLYRATCAPPLAEVVAGGEYLNFDNYQVRMLADALDVPYGKLTDKHLYRALSNLETLDLVGLTETLADDARQLGEIYGPGLDIGIDAAGDGWVNVNPHERPDDRTIDAVRRHNLLDLELYRRAAARRAPDYSI